jgi:hypothetical protein
LRQSIHPIIFNNILAICNIESRKQKMISDRQHQKKLNWILNQRTTSTIVNNSPNSPSPQVKRLTVLSSQSQPVLTPADISLLEKGPKFIPSISKVDDRCLLDFKVGFQRLMHHIRWQENGNLDQTSGFVSCPDFKEIRRPPMVDGVEEHLKIITSKFQSVLNKIHNKKVPRNLSQLEWRALTSLKRSPLTILPSDKGGDFCICDSATYIQAVESHLSNSAIYRRLSFVDVIKVEDRINSVWRNICQKRKIPRAIAIQYNSSASRIATFKGLVKTHKQSDEPVIRPVVNTIRSPTYKISWLLLNILSQNTSRSSHSFSNSLDIIHSLKDRHEQFRSRLIYPFSLDIVNMYTSVPRQASINMVCTHLQSNGFCYHGLTTMDIKELLNVILDCSYFRYDKKIFKQLHGLPMGNKISGLMADFYLKSLETRLIPQPTILFYSRYVDDCLVLTNSREDASNIHTIFNTCDPNIKFEIEHPTDNTLSLLDFSLSCTDNGLIFQPFKKAIRSDIFLSGKTALPTSMKRNVIINEWKRIRDRCDNEGDMRRERELFIHKLKSNGHFNLPFLEIHARPNHRENNTNPNIPVFYLKIPFINDHVNSMVRKCFKNSNYNVRITHKGRNLSQILNQHNLIPPTRNGSCNLTNCSLNNNLCFKSMIVYEARCNRCNSFYLGSTKKFFHLRVREHFQQRSSSIYKHNFSCKGTWSFSVKHNSNSLQDLRWVEAILIRQNKPTLNKKDDMMDLSTFLLV